MEGGHPVIELAEQAFENIGSRGLVTEDDDAAFGGVERG